MYEEWVDVADASVRLIVEAGSGLPADLGPRDWKRVGPAEPDTAAAAEIAQKGFCFTHTDKPLPPSIDPRDAGAAGA